MTPEDIYAARLRTTIARMQPELPPDARRTGRALREWQDEAERIYRAIREAARRGEPSPYMQRPSLARLARREPRAKEFHAIA
jgi:hypothetical protein